MKRSVGYVCVRGREGVKIWIGYSVTMNLQFFFETGEICPQWLKIALLKELGNLVHKYRITI